jgi:hypothetical protein
VVHYYVYPVDPGNDIATKETKANLKNLDTNASIVPTREDDLLTIWSISSLRSDLQASISAVKGIRHVEKEVNHRLLATAGISESERPPELARRDIRSYVVLGKNLSDPQEVETFLRSKVQPNTGQHINQMTRRGKVVGCARLLSDKAARAEVADYPGLSNLQETLKPHQD